MSIIESISHEYLIARKNRNAKKSALLSTLLSEAQMVGKNNGNRKSTDGEVVAVIKKMINNTNETINILSKSETDTGQVADLLAELTTLSLFLPPQLSEQELKNVISTLVAITNAKSIKDMGKVMKKLKEDFDGRYDGTEASKIIKEQLNVNI